MLENQNGATIANDIFACLERGNKISAIKALRRIDVVGRERSGCEHTANISLIDCKLFVEEVQRYIEEIRQDAKRQTPDVLAVELENYKRLREAGYNFDETIKILQVLS